MFERKVLQGPKTGRISADRMLNVGIKQCVTTKRSGTRETIIRKLERRGKAKAKFLEEQRQ